VAGLAGVPARHADVGGEALGRLLERDLHVVAKVRAAIGIGATARTGAAPHRAAEDVAEDVAERIGKATEALRARPARPAAHVGIDARMAKAVVRSALARVREDLVGLLDLLELLFGLLGLLALVAVRVELHRELAIGLLDLLFGRVLCHAEDVVEISLRHVALAYPSTHATTRKPLNAQTPS
jgi:hypothetical protein